LYEEYPFLVKKIIYVRGDHNNSREDVNIFQIINFIKENIEKNKKKYITNINSIPNNNKINLDNINTINAIPHNNLSSKASTQYSPYIPNN
jgi:hypothetical protein